MNGHIKINRKIMDWEWWYDEPVFRLWITILLLANWEDKEWRGIHIPRGSFYTSLDSLSKKTGLSRQEVRTALEKLKATHNITQQSTHHGTLITVVKYGDYQSKPRKSNTPSNTPCNTKSTHTEEYKKKIWGEGGIIREYI